MHVEVCAALSRLTGFLLGVLSGVEESLSRLYIFLDSPFSQTSSLLTSKLLAPSISGFYSQDRGKLPLQNHEVYRLESWRASGSKCWEPPVSGSALSSALCSRTNAVSRVRWFRFLFLVANKIH